MRRRDAFHQFNKESHAMAYTQKPPEKPADPQSSTADPRTTEQIERDHQAKFEADQKAEDQREVDKDESEAKGKSNEPTEDGDNWRHADRPAPDPNAPRKGAANYGQSVAPNEDPNSSGKLDPEV